MSTDDLRRVFQVESHDEGKGHINTMGSSHFRYCRLFITLIWQITFAYIKCSMAISWVNVEQWLAANKILSLSFACLVTGVTKHFMFHIHL
jgi:hypothetical protein